MRAVFVASASGLSVLLSCAGSPSPPAETAPSPAAIIAETEGPSDEHAGPCAEDAECLIGTPRDCCASWCPEDSEAWTRVAWAAYQAECAVQECPALEEPACRPGPRTGRARCVASRCVLEAEAAAR